MAGERFPILFKGPNRAMVLLGITPAGSWVEVDERGLRVRMSWAFGLRAPIEHVRDAAPYGDRVWSWGAHGWRGRWLVNGSSSRIVLVELSPPARGHVCGFPIRVRELLVSVVDPDGLLAALAPSAGEGGSF
jgi:hypothetical protein